jgi:hypothetical protein
MPVKHTQANLLLHPGLRHALLQGPLTILQVLRVAYAPLLWLFRLSDFLCLWFLLLGCCTHQGPAQVSWRT